MASENLAQNLRSKFVSRTAIPSVNVERLKRDFFPMVKSGSLNKYDIAKLQETGFDLNRVDEEGKPALYYAVLNQNLPVVRLLVEAGADVNKRFPPHDNNLGHLILSVYETIQESGPQWYYQGLNNNNNYSSNAIKEANQYVEDEFERKRNDFLRILSFLVEKGLDLNAKSNLDRSPLGEAYMVGDELAFHALLDLGADPNTIVEGEPLINNIIENSEPFFPESDKKMFQALLDHGADVTQKGESGVTAIELLPRFPRMAEVFPPEKLLANAAWKKRGAMVAMRRRLQESRRRRPLLSATRKKNNNNSKNKNLKKASESSRNAWGGRRQAKTRRNRKGQRQTRKN
jgi:ankyrin repeat protein